MAKRFIYLCSIFLFLLTFNSCVIDDDFDTPDIPPIDQPGGDDIQLNSCLVEDFESYNNEQTAFPSYFNVALAGERFWRIQEFDDNQYIDFSAFNGSGSYDTWFAINVDFDEADQFSFKTKDGFNNGEVLSVYYITESQVTENINPNSWTEITDEFNISDVAAEDGFANGFTNSGVWDLDDLSGEGFIAFRYQGSSDGVTTSMQIDDIAIIDTDDDDCEAPDTGDDNNNGEQTSKGGSAAEAQTCLAEMFEESEEGEDTFPAYENVAVEGDRFWEIESFDDNQYIQASAFQGDGAYDMWFLVNVNFDEADIFSFATKDGFNRGDVLTVLHTTDHAVGEEIDPSEWTNITSEFAIADGPEDDFADEFTPSGEFDLSGLSGQGFIAFRYQGNADIDLTTTMQVDNITIIDNDDSECEVNTGLESCFEETFESSNVDDVELANYQNISTEGRELWSVQDFNDQNNYIEMSAFETGSKQSSWFIMGVNFDNAAAISFETKDGFNNGDPLTVLYSTDYDEQQGDPTVASWTDITGEFDIATGTSQGFPDEFTPSGEYSFEGLSGNGYIAFKYDGEEGNNGTTTTIQIDNIQLLGSDNCYNQLPTLADPGEEEPQEQVSKGGQSATAQSCIEEGFESYNDGQEEFSAYENIQILGDRFWQVGEFEGNKYIETSAFEGEGAYEMWYLFNVNFDEADEFSFKTKDAFNNGDVLTVLHSTNHNVGQEIDPSEWTDITNEFTFAEGATGGFADEFTESGVYDLSNLSGQGFIAFRYQGHADDGPTTTMQVDDIAIIDNDDSECGDDDGGTVENANARINEFHYNDAGDDEGEFLEIRIEGGQNDQPDDLSAYTVELYNGSNNSTYDSETLDNLNQTCADGFCYYVWETTIQNGDPDGIALTGPAGLIEFISYGGTITAADGIASGETSTDIGVVEANETVEGSSLQRTDDGTEWKLTDGNNTKGSANEFDDGGTTEPSGGDLIISEYAEGSLNDKYIEIYNGTGQAVDLTDYKVTVANDGFDWDLAFTNIDLEGTLNDGETYLIVNSLANSEMRSEAQKLTFLSIMNGNDAVGLFKGEDVIDQIGEAGVNPGNGWDVAGVETATFNHTLVRKPSITEGNTNWAESAGTNADDSEWIVKEVDDFSSFGER